METSTTLAVVKGSNGLSLQGVRPYFQKLGSQNLFSRDCPPRAHLAASTAVEQKLASVKAGPKMIVSNGSNSWHLDSFRSVFSRAPTDSKTASAKDAEERPDWNPVQTLAAAALDFVEYTFIANLEKQHPLPKTVDPEVQISGNFAPVSENPVRQDIPVVGQIPECVEGVYVRNGANPRFVPLAGHHFFDGDGMIHAVKLNRGTASYCCRYTRTRRLAQEEKIGRAIFPKAIGELHGHAGVARLLLFYARALFGLVDSSEGMGVANAGLIFFNGRLLAMSEDDLPYAVNITAEGDLETSGRFDFDGQLKSAMIAHPKLDPETRELFALSYDVLQKPYLKYFVFYPDGRKGPDVTISIKEPTMMHDFAITRNFVVVPDQQVVFRLADMITGGSPVIYNENKVPRFGVLPKYDSDESRMVWIDVPDCFCFHLWNAWEDGDEVVVIGSCMTPPDCIFNDSDQALRSVLSEIRLNIRNGSCTKREIVPLNLEAGQVNRNLLGRKTRYAYLAIAEPWPKVSGVAKVDLLMQSEGNIEERIVGKITYGPGCYGGEPFFVPRTSDPTAPEDDGYILTFMHNEATSASELLILDAKSPNLEAVASIKLPSRVPYGFHGTFLTPDDLAKQSTR